MTVRLEELTDVEKQVLVHGAEGWTSAEIAKEMHYSVETIRSAWKAIYWKLEARNRSHAVVIAMRMGVVSTEEEQ